MTCEYKRGDALPSERDISESLGVSRIPVREAMKSLEYLGIVKQVRGKGVFVQKTDPGEVLAKGVTGTKDPYWYECGMPEAMWPLQTKHFGPFLITMDSYGKSRYDDVQAHAQAVEEEILKTL